MKTLPNWADFDRIERTESGLLSAGPAGADADTDNDADADTDNDADAGEDMAATGDADAGGS